MEDNKSLQFKWLSVLSNKTDNEIVLGLLEFVESYRKWISQLDADGYAVGQENIGQCRKDFLRIRQNIEEFLTDSEKMKIFRLMNMMPGVTGNIMIYLILLSRAFLGK